MNWKHFWNRMAGESGANDQVGRISNRITIDDPLLDRIADHIASLLDLQPEDELLDVCCGNGILSRRLARKCYRLVGVDLSEAQIQHARLHATEPNTSYFTGDATALSAVVKGAFPKVSLYFSFQYLDSFSKGQKAIREMLALLKPGGKILLGDVPDQQYLIRYYGGAFNSFRYYHVGNLLGRNDMGRFWSEKELQRICRESGVRCEWLAQPEWMPYAHYRSDCLISKP